MKKARLLLVAALPILLAGCDSSLPFSSFASDSSLTTATSEATSETVSLPTSEPTSEPTSAPTSEPTSVPSSSPTSEPSSSSSSSSTSETYTGYYKTINSGMTGGTTGTLRAALTSLIKPKAYFTYSGDGSGKLGTELMYYDEDPNNSSNMILFYTQKSIKKCTSSGAKNWNREHCWPQNLSGGLYGTSGAGADLLHIRPTYEKDNSLRANYKYGECPNATWQTKEDSNYICGRVANGYFEPIDSVKGDCARIVFYMFTAYYNEFSARSVTIKNVAKDVALMVKWAKEDPPSAQERLRNDRAEASKQKNRNPYVDHPEWVEKIFG